MGNKYYLGHVDHRIDLSVQAGGSCGQSFIESVVILQRSVRYAWYDIPE